MKCLMIRTLIFVCLMFAIDSAWSQQATIAVNLCWDPSPSPDVVRYKIYVDGVYKEGSTTTTGTVGGLLPGRVYGMYVTAENAQGLESDPSNELRWAAPILTISPDLVVSFQLPDRTKWANQEYFLESTSDFKEWRNEVYVEEGEMGKLYIGPPEPYRFFRVRVNIRKEGCAAGQP